MGVASLPLSFPCALWNIGILHYKQAKLPKHLQHSVYRVWFQNSFTLLLEILSNISSFKKTTLLFQLRYVLNVFYNRIEKKVSV